MIRKLFVLILFFSFLKVTHSQDTTLYIHSWKQPKKTAILTNSLKFTLNYTEVTNDSVKFYKDICLSGWLIHVDSSSLVMKLSYDSINIKYPNGLRSTVYSYDDKASYNFSKPIPTSIKFNNITSINYYSNDHPLRVFGGILVFSSFLTALVIAPLVSINYRNGNINEHKYYSVLKYCGGGIAVGIPIMIIFEGKYHAYDIINNKPDYVEDYYSYHYLKNK